MPLVTLPMVTLPMVTLPLVKADSQGLWQTFAAENYKKSYLSVEMQLQATATAGNAAPVNHP